MMIQDRETLEFRKFTVQDYLDMRDKIMDLEARNSELQNAFDLQHILFTEAQEQLVSETNDANKWCQLASDYLRLFEHEQTHARVLLAEKLKLDSKVDRMSDEIDSLTTDKMFHSARAVRLENMVVKMQRALAELVNETETELINEYS